MTVSKIQLHDVEDILGVIKSNLYPLILGPTGSGKTYLLTQVAELLSSKLYIHPCGSTQDARTSLLGHFELVNGETQWVFSPFIEALRSEEPILIVLDELSRASDDAMNILFPVLDFRASIYVEEAKTEVKIGSNVQFASTANIGLEYSAARAIDLALADRFVPFQFDKLSTSQVDMFLEAYKVSIESRELLSTVHDMLTKLDAKQEITRLPSIRQYENIIKLSKGLDVSEDTEKYIRIVKTIITSMYLFQGEEDHMKVSQNLNMVLGDYVSQLEAKKRAKENPGEETEADKSDPGEEAKEEDKDSLTFESDDKMWTIKVTGVSQ